MWDVCVGSHERASRQPTRGISRSSTTELAENEICGLYNSRGGCPFGAKCTKTHVCNYVVRGADGSQRLCGKKHTRFEHK